MKHKINKFICFLIGHKIKATWFTSFQQHLAEMDPEPDIEYISCPRCRCCYMPDDTYNQYPESFTTLPDIIILALDDLDRWMKGL